MLEECDFVRHDYFGTDRPKNWTTKFVGLDYKVRQRFYFFRPK